MARPTHFDLLVLGGGPAGAAAALFGARAGLRTVLFESQAEQPAGLGVEWLHPQGRKLLAESGVRLPPCLVGSLSRVKFVEVERDRTSNAALHERVALVDVAALVVAVRRAAQAAGAVGRLGESVADVHVAEQEVWLSTTGGGSAAGRVLLVADGADSHWAPRLLSRGAPRGAADGWCCEAVVARPTHATSKASRPRVMTIVLDVLRPHEYGFVFGPPGAAVGGLVGQCDERTLLGRFAEQLPRWVERGWLPAPSAFDGSAVRTRRLPRGAALERESHVGKRCLVIGDAGGFVSALGHEGLYPAVWGARMAVDVCRRALASDHPQDVLADFDPAWRREMVDYLRLPNTDLRFLLPLVFTNSLLAAKLADAFILGRNL